MVIRFVRSWLVVALVASCVSCANKDNQLADDQLLEPPDKPTYAQLAAAQNKRIAHLHQLYGNGTISVEWTDDKGQQQREGGEGNLIFQRPGNVALTFRKLGKVYVWAGSDSDRLWIVVGGDESVAYIARIENVGKPCCEPIAMPVYPGELMALYGVIEFPQTPSPVRFDAQANTWTVTLGESGTQWRLHFPVGDASRYPSQVELIDSTGTVLVRSDLSRYQKMEVRDLGPADEPTVPTWMTVTTMGQDDRPAQLTVKLSAPSDVPIGHREMPPGIFEFSAIRANMRPDSVTVLDRACTNPAAIDDEN